LLRGITSSGVVRLRRMMFQYEQSSTRLAVVGAAACAIDSKKMVKPPVKPCRVGAVPCACPRPLLKMIIFIVGGVTLHERLASACVPQHTRGFGQRLQSWQRFGHRPSPPCLTVWSARPRCPFVGFNAACPCLYDGKACG